MNLETRAREAAESLRTVTPVDAEGGLHRLHRTYQRRTTGKVIAAIAAVAVGVGVVQVQFDQRRAAPPVSPPQGNWVLVTGNGAGGADNPVQPTGDEWAEPLAEDGVQSYPNFRSADPATGRFLVLNQDATAWSAMTPGKREPVATVAADFGVSLGPGPDEFTTLSSDLTSVVVLGPSRAFRGTIGAAWAPKASANGYTGGFVWSPDGETWAETRYQWGRDQGSLTIVLRDPDSAEVFTLYEYSEAAPTWFDVEQHRFGSGPGQFNDWGAPRLVDLRWAPDSTRLAFVTLTSRGGGGGDRQVEWQLFVADTATGVVEQIAELGRCTEPVDDEGSFQRVCTPVHESARSLAWTPDGESLTVLSEGSLTTYDLTGQVLSSEPTDIKGPIVWLTSK